MHVLENEETGEEPHRQRRLSVSSRVDLAEAPVEETPVDLPGQPHQRIANVDDRFQGRPEKVRLPIVARFLHLDSPRRIDAGIESKNARMRNLEASVRSGGGTLMAGDVATSLKPD